jgi:hypothetical protein
MFGPNSVASALSVKEFTKTRDKSKKSFNLLSKGGKDQIPWMASAS